MVSVWKVKYFYKHFGICWNIWSCLSPRSGCKIFYPLLQAREFPQQKKPKTKKQNKWGSCFSHILNLFFFHPANIYNGQNQLWSVPWLLTHQHAKPMFGCYSKLRFLYISCYQHLVCSPIMYLNQDENYCNLYKPKQLSVLLKSDWLFVTLQNSSIFCPSTQ